MLREVLGEWEAKGWTVYGVSGEWALLGDGRAPRVLLRMAGGRGLAYEVGAQFGEVVAPRPPEAPVGYGPLLVSGPLDVGATRVDGVVLARGRDDAELLAWAQRHDAGLAAQLAQEERGAKLDEAAALGPRALAAHLRALGLEASEVPPLEGRPGGVACKGLLLTCAEGRCVAKQLRGVALLLELGL